MTKPIVRYNKILTHPSIGEGAVVWPVDHTSTLVSNTCWATTSPVIRIADKGFFETENSIYMPVEGTTNIHPEYPPTDEDWNWESP